MNISMTFIFYIVICSCHRKIFNNKYFLMLHIQYNFTDSYFLPDFIDIIIVVISPPYNTVAPNNKTAIADPVILKLLHFYSSIFLFFQGFLHIKNDRINPAPTSSHP